MSQMIQIARTHFRLASRPGAAAETFDGLAR
jgi:hypothetical protein